MATIITEEALEKLLSNINIPPRPAVVEEIARERKKPEPDLRKIAQIISRDIALTAGVLKTANSPLFGRGKKSESVQQAVMTLGLDNVAVIVTGLALKNAVGGEDFKLGGFWDSANKVANIAAYLAGKVPGVPKDLAYMYGLFRDCGIPFMLQKYPDYADTLLMATKGPKLAFTRIEDEAYHANHATMGYLLAKSWSMPNSLCQAVLNHHDISTLDSAEELSAEVRGLIALLRVAEHLYESRMLHKDHDWMVSGPIVLAYLGLSEGEFEDIKEDVFRYREEAG
jgi:HD-like signal output (HDOD) protein